MLSTSDKIERGWSFRLRAAIDAVSQSLYRVSLQITGCVAATSRRVVRASMWHAERRRGDTTATAGATRTYSLISSRNAIARRAAKPSGSPRLTRDLEEDNTVRAIAFTQDLELFLSVVRAVKNSANRSAGVTASTAVRNVLEWLIGGPRSSASTAARRSGRSLCRQQRSGDFALAHVLIAQGLGGCESHGHIATWYGFSFATGSSSATAAHAQSVIPVVISSSTTLCRGATVATIQKTTSLRCAARAMRRFISCAETCSCHATSLSNSHLRQAVLPSL